jgi:hypothetical protein
MWSTFTALPTWPPPASAYGAANVVDTGTGNDRVNAYGMAQIVNTGEGDDKVNIAGFGGSVTTGTGNDSVNTYGSAMLVDTGSGQDTVRAVGSATLINTGDDADKVTAYGVGMQIYTGTGDDVISAIGAGMRIFAGSGNDQINVTGALAAIDGGEGNDSITAVGAGIKAFGGAGSDTMKVSGAEVSMTGGAGSDTYIYQLGTGMATVYAADAGNGKDTLQLQLNSDAGAKSWDNIFVHVDITNAGQGADLYFLDKSSGMTLGLLSLADGRSATSDLTSIQMLDSNGQVTKSFSGTELGKLMTADMGELTKEVVDLTASKIDSMSNVLSGALNQGLQAIQADNLSAGVATPPFTVASEADLSALAASQAVASGSSGSA